MSFAAKGSKSVVFSIKVKLPLLGSFGHKKETGKSKLYVSYSSRQFEY